MPFVKQQSRIKYHIINLVTLMSRNAFGAKCYIAVVVGANNAVPIWSVTTRLIPAGIRRLNECKSDSTWATGMCSFAAANAQVNVELISP